MRRCVQTFGLYCISFDLKLNCLQCIQKQRKLHYLVPILLEGTVYIIRMCHNILQGTYFRNPELPNPVPGGLPSGRF